MDFEEYRCENGEIDLEEAYAGFNGEEPGPRAAAYLRTIRSMQPIISRQLAAAAIATATYLEEN